MPRTKFSQKYRIEHQKVFFCQQCNKKKPIKELIRGNHGRKTNWCKECFKECEQYEQKII